jgi:antitoxin HicB
LLFDTSGDTMCTEDTAAKLLDAMRRNPSGWSIEELVTAGRHIPAPYFPIDVSVSDLSGKFLTRVRKSVQAQLARRAESDGVSRNTLVLASIAEGVGRHESRV